MAKIETTSLVFSIPTEHFNQLNNFYLENFGYDVFTQLFNYINSELQQCEGYPTETSELHPRPRIRKKRRNFALEIRYPDDTTSSIENQTWEKSIDLMNEWSKYNYDKSAREKVLLKVFSDSEINERVIPNIRKDHSKYAVAKKIDGRNRYFGHYDSINDAVEVRDFLEEHGWDIKYHSSKIMENREDITQYNYSEYMLNLVKGGVEYVEK